jgi:hypothetical protein
MAPARGAWVAEVASAAAQGEPGTLGDMFDSPVGYHLVLLETPARDMKIPFADAQEMIRAKMQAGAFERETDLLYRRLREEVPVRILMPDHPPRYGLAEE